MNGSPPASGLRARVCSWSAEWSCLRTPPPSLQHILPGSPIWTDGNSAYRGLPDRHHAATVLGQMPAHVFMPGIHRVFSNLKRRGLMTYRTLTKG